VLIGCGVAAASALTGRMSPAGVTLTVTVPTQQTTDITLTVAPPDDSQNVRAALADPAKIRSIQNARTRQKLIVELRALDAFIAKRPKLRHYRTNLWYVAHHVHPALQPKYLAALVWCSLAAPRGCG
jgi:hypothetical protein